MSKKQRTKQKKLNKLRNNLYSYLKEILIKIKLKRK